MDETPTCLQLYGKFPALTSLWIRNCYDVQDWSFLSHRVLLILLLYSYVLVQMRRNHARVHSKQCVGVHRVCVLDRIARVYGR